MMLHQVQSMSSQPVSTSLRLSSPPSSTPDQPLHLQNSQHFRSPVPQFPFLGLPLPPLPSSSVADLESLVYFRSPSDVISRSPLPGQAITSFKRAGAGNCRNSFMIDDILGADPQSPSRVVVTNSGSEHHDDDETAPTRLPGNVTPDSASQADSDLRMSRTVLVIGRSDLDLRAPTSPSSSPHTESVVTSTQRPHQHPTISPHHPSRLLIRPDTSGAGLLPGTPFEHQSRIAHRFIDPASMAAATYYLNAHHAAAAAAAATALINSPC